MNKILTIVLCVTLFISGISVAQVAMPNRDDAGSAIISLNGTWKFKYIPSINTDSDTEFYKPDFDVENWKEIKVPGHWEMQGFAEPKYGSDLEEGTGLYRTTFDVPEKWNGKQIFIVFEGVQYGYDLWVNGQYAGQWASSYNRQMFDITKFANVGSSNSLAVKVITRGKAYEFDTNDAWALSGIFRDVNLIGLPKTHIKDITVKTYVKDGENPQMAFSVEVEKVQGATATKKLSLGAKLFSTNGKLIKEFTSDEFNLKKSDTTHISAQFDCKNVGLWTAETPNLYNLEISLFEKEKLIQQTQKKVGFREVSIDGEVLKLNGQPIKLRGVDHHDIDPYVGRALTPDLILKDLLMIKKANINFVRTSHYPPHPKMIELCDSLGLYVMCEVPFGYGDEHLKDATYLDILLTRAKATINRDKNNPSVIIWSIGNENPLTDITKKTGQYVKKMDDTRPICFPQMGGYFANHHEEIPEFVDILAPHYSSSKRLKQYAGMFNRPLIETEYAHSLGLDFDQVQDMWEIMYKEPSLAGGSVWLFQDQGILRTAEKPVDKNVFTNSVWLDSLHYFDSSGDKGADGIVYANRVPQVDYWQLRKVYAPVQAINDSIVIKPGKQDLNFKIENRFDFTNLSDVECKWSITADGKSIQEGTIDIEGAPHNTTLIELPVTLPQELSAHYYLLNLSFIGKDNYQFNEKTYRLWSLNPQELSMVDLVNNPVEKPSLTNNKMVFKADLGNAIFTLDKKTGGVRIEDAQTKQLLLEGPFARVGRKTTMSMLYVRERDKTGVSTNWDPFILKNPNVEVGSVSSNAIECNYKFERADKEGEYIEGTVTFSVSEKGSIEVKYHFEPVNGTAFFAEAGITFLVPLQYSEMRWIGNGPYPSYPGKSKLNEFGFYHMNSEDINYQGNRSDIDLMLMTDNNGNGFAIQGNHANVAVENTPEGILLSHNAIVSGRYTKFTKPAKLYNAEDVKVIEGNFSIVPIDVENTSPKLINMFGELSEVAIPFKPFYHSYDQ